MNNAYHIDIYGKWNVGYFLSCVCISYGLEAWNDYEDLTETLYRLNKQLCSPGVLLKKTVGP